MFAGLDKDYILTLGLFRPAASPTISWCPVHCTSAVDSSDIFVPKIILIFILFAKTVFVFILVLVYEISLVFNLVGRILDSEKTDNIGLVLWLLFIHSSFLRM